MWRRKGNALLGIKNVKFWPKRLRYEPVYNVIAPSGNKQIIPTRSRAFLSSGRSTLVSSVANGSLYFWQVRIHTGFHRFRQSVKFLGMIQKPKKGNLRELKSKTFPERAWPRTKCFCLRHSFLPNSCRSAPVSVSFFSVHRMIKNFSKTPNR